MLLPFGRWNFSSFLLRKIPHLFACVIGGRGIERERKRENVKLRNSVVRRMHSLLRKSARKKKENKEVALIIITLVVTSDLTSVDVSLTSVSVLKL